MTPDIENLIREIDWAPYERVARRLLGEDVQLRLVGPDPSAEPAEHSALPDDRHMQYRVPIVEDESGALFSWQLTVPTHLYRQSRWREDAEQLLQDINQPILTQLHLHSELDQMAVELADRYDELNLAYQNRDIDSDTQTCTDVIHDMMHNCAEHLALSVAGLCMPSRDMRIQTESDPELPDDLDLDALMNKLYTLLYEGAGAFALNEPNDPLREEYCLPSAIKIVVVPLVDAVDRIFGVLVGINSSSKADFSNSDRKLLELIAEKIARRIKIGQDRLTGLVNRDNFSEQLGERLATSTNADNVPVLAVINIDQFKVVNDSYGFAAGDEVLKQFAKRITQYVPSAAIKGRVGRDEFALLFTDIDLDGVRDQLQCLRKVLQEEPLRWGDKKLRIEFSVGLLTIAEAYRDVASALVAVELALAAAKEKGGDRMEVYGDENSTPMQRHHQMQLVEQIKDALDEDRFVLYCQPIVPLQHGARHYEILLRMVGSDGAVLAPGVFFSSAERFGLMPAIDRWVIEHALESIGDANRNCIAEGAKWGINLSGQSLNTEGFEDFLIGAIEDSGVPASQLYFEITETAAVESFQETVALIRRIQQMGCEFALDDFGTGVSSFTYLKNLPVDYLKIDGAFVRDMLDDAFDRAMIDASTRISHVMGLRTIAEFVEDEATLDALRSMGVDYAQGYVISKPIPLDNELARLRRECEKSSQNGKSPARSRAG